MRCDNCGGDTTAYYDSDEKVWKIECRFCRKVLFRSRSILAIIAKIRGDK